MAQEQLKAMVFEPFAGGHCSWYVSAILPGLIALRQAGQLAEVVFTTTVTHYESPEFADLIAPFERDVRFDIVPSRKFLNGRDVARMLCDAVIRNQPDYIVSTYADRGSFPLALRTFGGGAFAKRDMDSIGIIHHGFLESPRDARKRIQAGIHRFSRAFAPWSEIHMVNPLLFDVARKECRRAAKSLKLLPHPVEIRAPIDRTEARRRLNLPLQGAFVGQIGKSDGRKAIPELLAAFRAARPSSDAYLVLAGILYPPHRVLVDTSYADLVQDGRLIVIDRYLDPAEFHLAVSAMDFVSCAYYSDGLSANLLTALAAGRPVIAADSGYAAKIIATFDVGYATNVYDHFALTSTVERALAVGANYDLADRAKALIRFHEPRNFMATLLAPLYVRLGIPPLETQTWESTLASVSTTSG